MCHCFTDVEELSAAERRDVLESHTREELVAELGEDTLVSLEASV